MVNIVEIACPRCHSTDVGHQRGDHYACNHCKTSFIVDRNRPAPPPAMQWGAGPPVVAPPPSHPSRAPAIAIAVVLALVVMGVAISLFLSAPAPSESGPTASAPSRSAAQPVVTPAPARVGVEAEVEVVAPKAELFGTRKGKSSTGAQYWLTEYKNVGETPIERPAALVSLFDEGGGRVGEQAGWAKREVLGPGESFPLLVMIAKAPKYAKEEVAPRDPQAPRHPSKQVPIAVTEHRIQPSFGNLKEIVGSVKNEQSAAVKFVEVIAVGRDADGGLASIATAFASKRELGPGDDAGFKISTGTFEVAEPTTYELHAYARLAN